MGVNHDDSNDSVQSSSEAEGPTETKSPNHMPATTADGNKMSRSSSISSSSSDGDFFQFDVSHLANSAGSLNSGNQSIKLLVPVCTNQLVSVEKNGPCRVDNDTSKNNNEVQIVKGDDEFSATSRSEDPKASPDLSVSSSGSNCRNRIPEETVNEDDVELMLEEIDVPSEMTFKGNHSALDYSYVSKSEKHSSYVGFAKQSLIGLSNGKAEAYDPSRIPASIFSKPQNAMEWSVASNDSTYGQDKQQRMCNAMAVPHTSSMPRRSDPSNNNNGSFAFPTLGADGRSVSVKANDAGHDTPQVDVNNHGSWFSCACCPCTFCSG